MGTDIVAADHHGSQMVARFVRFDNPDETPPTTDTLAKLAPGQYGRISARVRIHRTFVGRILTGRRGVTFKVAARLAACADVSIDELYRFIAARPVFELYYRDDPDRVPVPPKPRKPRYKNVERRSKLDWRLV